MLRETLAGRVSDVIAGAFTEPGRKQKLVLFFAGHCDEQGSHAENWGQRLLILLENETVLRASVDPSTSSLLAVDVDNDGRNEFITWGGWAGGGGPNSWLAVQSYAGGIQTLLADFPACPTKAWSQVIDSWRSWRNLESSSTVEIFRRR